MNKVEGCVYDSGRPFKSVASSQCRAPIYNNSLAFLIFHKCEGKITPMRGMAEFSGLVVDGETYFCPEFSNYYEQAIPVLVQQPGSADEPIKWGQPTGLNMATHVYGSRNGFLVNAIHPPLGAYCDLRLTNQSALAQSTVLTPQTAANNYPVDSIVHAGDIFTVNTAGTKGKCMFSLIPYTTYYPQGATCYKYDDHNGNLISEFYENPDFQAFTNPCHCNPRLRRCLTRKEDFEIDTLIANGEDDVEAGTQVVLHNTIENERARKRLRGKRHTRKSKMTDAEIGGAVMIGVVGLGVVLFVIAVAINEYRKS